VAYPVVILAGRWSDAFYACWEPLFAWNVILSLLVFFQRRFAALGPIWQKLARRAYLIYIIHPPILVGVSLAIRALAGRRRSSSSCSPERLPASCASWPPERCWRSRSSGASSSAGCFRATPLAKIGGTAS